MKKNNKITIEEYNGVYVLRDDLLAGGTKSVLMPHILDNEINAYVYASPVYGAFQVALAEYCKLIGKKAVIFCAKRKIKHPNTLAVEALGGIVKEIKAGYLNVVQKHAKDYAKVYQYQYLPFGAYGERTSELLATRANQVFEKLGFVPDEVYCAIGSGTLYEALLLTQVPTVYGVSVGKAYNKPPRTNGVVIKYPLGFEKECKTVPPFKSSINYDAKAWEVLMQNFKGNEFKKILFWNVY